MEITSEQVRILRERTGAGMMDCKKALVESNGDIDAAVEAMRKKSLTQADKKAGRTAAEGAISIKETADHKKVVMIETNCETDFVTRDSNFTEFVKAITDKALEAGVQDINALSQVSLGKETIEEARKNLVSKIGENIQIRRLIFMNAQGQVGTYIHNARMGVVVDVVGGDETLRKDIAMHIAASGPRVVSPENVPEELIAKEKEIAMAQAQATGKPENVLIKIVEGKIAKFVADVSLLTQVFVKDPSLTIEALLKKSNAKVVSFVRFEVGEGIEKNTGNFAEEVMAQAQGK